MPGEDTVRTLKNFITSKIVQGPALINKQFCFVRALVVSELTLLNGRRGNECTNMTVQNWQEAKLNKYFKNHPRKDMISPGLLERYKLTYISGKGKKAVPVLIPDSCFEILDMLTDPLTRSKAGIHPENNFVFPSSGSSLFQACGYSDLQSIAKKAGVKITATGMRHLLSTHFSVMDFTAQERDVLYEHFSHAENINKEVYQAPRSIQELTVATRAIEGFHQYLSKLGVVSVFYEMNFSYNFLI